MTEPETTPNQPDDDQPQVAQAQIPEPQVDQPQIAQTSVAQPQAQLPGLLEVGSDIGWPETEAETATRARFAATPAGVSAYGRLADLAIWLSGVQGVSPPREPQRPRLIVFAAGAAAAEAGPGSNDGADPAAVFAGAAGVGLRVVAVDTGVDAGLHASLDPGLDPGLDTGPETSADVHANRDAATRAAIAIGVQAADEEIDAGADLLAVGVLGSGSATAAAVVVSVMTLVEPIKVVGSSSPLGDQAWMRQVAQIRDTRLRALPHRHDVEALLATVGGADLAAITGFLVRAAARRTPVILDGTIVGAASLLAREISPNVVRWWQCGERGADPANLLAMAEFSAVPLLDLGLEVGDGVGAALSIPLLRAAARAANELSVIA